MLGRACGPRILLEKIKDVIAEYDELTAPAINCQLFFNIHYLYNSITSNEIKSFLTFKDFSIFKRIFCNYFL